MHGGSVSAHSAGPGYGSEIIVRLPRLPEAQVEKARAASEGPPLRALRILVVDDEPDVADALAKWLRFEGHEVRVEYTGAAALEAAAAMGPEAVLLDIRMPKMDGYEVASRLRKVGLEGVPLIAVSGYNENPDRSKRGPFDTYLVKPIELEILRAALAGVAGASARKAASDENRPA